MDGHTKDKAQCLPIGWRNDDKKAGVYLSARVRVPSLS